AAADVGRVDNARWPRNNRVQLGEEYRGCGWARRQSGHVGALKYRSRLSWHLEIRGCGQAGNPDGFVIAVIGDPGRDIANRERENGVIVRRTCSAQVGRI